MKTKIFIILSAIILIYVAAAFAIPDKINYQGILRNAAGDLQDGNFTMRFRIYDASSAGNLKYDSGNIGVPVSNGLYNVELGPVTGEVFDGSNRWLQITVGTDTLTPRLKVNSVAYAIMADSAVTATSANYAAVSGQATNAASADYAVLSGTASNASTVADYSVSTTKIATGAVTGVKLASNIDITTTGSIAAQNLIINRFFTGGTGDGFCVGSSTLIAGDNSVNVTNSNASTNSKIFITQTSQDASTTFEALVVKGKAPGSFQVGIRHPLPAKSGVNITFDYLIIN